MLHDDNQLLTRMLETVKNPMMHYLHRTHRVSVAWLHEKFQRADSHSRYEQATKMCADIYTKAFSYHKSWGGEQPAGSSR